MEPFFRELWQKFWHDPLFIRRWGRAALMTMAMSGMGFADQITGLLAAPGLVTTIRVVAIVCGMISLAINAGEKNPTSGTGGSQ